MNSAHKRKPRQGLIGIIRHGDATNMNVNLEQLRALADLFVDAEALVELYWDTDNGQRLSSSLERARTAFPRLREELNELTCPAHSVELQPALKPSNKN